MSLLSGPPSARPTGKSRIVFALDVPNLDGGKDGRGGARDLARRLAGHVGMLKVGLELFVAEGPRVVAELAGLGLPIFLDLKMHDIPATVERAVDRAAALGVRILTVHAAGGAEMLRRAVVRADGRLLVTAVTVLTSLDDDDLAAQGVGGTTDAHARRLARLAYDAGVRGFVCSPHEAKAMRRDLGADAILITPGVRAGGEASADKADQKRVSSARAAVDHGADYVVVGRPLRDAADPVAAAEALARELS